MKLEFNWSSGCFKMLTEDRCLSYWYTFGSGEPITLEKGTKVNYLWRDHKVSPLTSSGFIQTGQNKIP